MLQLTIKSARLRENFKRVKVAMIRIKDKKRKIMMIKRRMSFV
jgi:hypothetical protein